MLDTNDNKKSKITVAVSGLVSVFLSYLQPNLIKSNDFDCDRALLTNENH